MMLKPPSSVPGAFRGAAMPPGIPAQRLPGIRYHISNGNETLADLATRYMNNPREAIAIFNANRSGINRADRTPGFLLTPHDRLPAGVAVLLP